MITFEEFNAKYKIGKLQDKNVVTDFDCGDRDLNDFILNEVMLYKEQLLAMPYVLVEQDNPENVVAYFTLSNDTYNDAVSFYERNGFEFLQAKDEQPTQLMFFDLMTIKKPA